MLRKTGGGYTDTPAEALNILLNTHFPGNSLDAPEDSTDNQACLDVPTGLLNLHKITSAISTFSPFTAPGHDGIYPIHLQKGCRILAPLLKDLYTAILKMNVVPKRWAAKLIFLPKPGKKTYQEAKSFRPISLTSVFLKLLEKLIDEFLKTKILIPDLHHRSQHAYREGRSTETAAHALLAGVEKSLEEGTFTLATLLDAEGAFNNVKTQAMVQSLKHRGIPEVLTRFIEKMLSNRSITADLLEYSSHRFISRGTPQGGVLSPRLWNLTVDGLLEQLEAELPHIQVVAYADDIALKISGTDPDTMSQLMTAALTRVANWCEEVGLNANPQKTEVIMFTRRKNWYMRPIKLNGTVLTERKEVRYLGLTLNRTLTWSKHINEKVSKCKAILSLSRKTIGVDWGLTPQQAMWVYTAIVRPIVGYGAVVWAHSAILNAQAKNKLNSLQRSACLSITGAMRSTPTAAMEVLLGLLPLDLFIKNEALKTQLRLKTNGEWHQWWGPKTTKTRGHVYWMEKWQRVDVSLFDDTKKQSLGVRRYNVSIPTRDDWNLINLTRPQGNEIHCFTDGSHMNGRSGAGVVIRTSQQDTLISIPLGTSATIYQAEMMGIISAVDKITQMELFDRKLNIYCDNQACLMTLKGHFVRSKLAIECSNRLNFLSGKQQETNLIWVPGHNNIEGNEKADEMAKKAAETPIAGPEPMVPLTKQAGNVLITKAIWKEALERWKSRKDCRQAKMWSPQLLSPSKTRFLLSLSRKVLKQLTGYITGHNLLNRHLQVMGLIADGTCRKCSEMESIFHVIAECQAYAKTRYETFGSIRLREADISNVSFQKLQIYMGKLALTVTTTKC